MPNEENKITQLLRVYRDMNDEDRRIVYEFIHAHQTEMVLERKSDILVEEMTKYGAIGPSAGGCPRCGYPN